MLNLWIPLLKYILHSQCPLYSIQTIFPSPGTPLFDDHKSGGFQPLSPREKLIELKLMMEELEVTFKVCFDHAANWWRGKNGGLLFSQSYEGYKFPEQKPQILKLIDEGIDVQKDNLGDPHIRINL